MNKVDQLLDQAEELEDNLTDDFLKEVDKVAREIDRDMIALAAQYGVDSKGFVKVVSLARITNDLDRLLKDAGYTKAVTSFLETRRDLMAATKKMWRTLHPKFDWKQQDLRTLAALMEIDLAVFEDISTKLSADAAKLIHKSILAGTPFKRLKAELGALLLGEDGDPSLVRHARTYAHDSIQNFNRTLDVIASGRIFGKDGAPYYYYAGTRMKTTRPFCRARAGKVYSRAEVLSWNDLSWNGKKPGDVRTVGGGWNCRHRLIGVTKEWAHAQGKI